MLQAAAHNKEHGDFNLALSHGLWTLDSLFGEVTAISCMVA